MSILCLVATSLRAARVARRLCDAQEGISLGTRVATIDALAADLLAAGRDGRVLLTPMAEHLLVLEAGEAVGGPLAGMLPDGGAARELASTLLDLRRDAVSATDLLSASRAESGRSAERLRLLGEVLEVYERRLAELGALDRAGARRAAAETLERGAAHDLVRGIDVVVVEGFQALPSPAFDLIAKLAARVQRTQLRVPYFSDCPEVSSAAEPLLRSLEGLHELAVNRDVIVETEDLATRAPRLQRALLALAGSPVDPADGSEGGTVLAETGPGARGEAEVAARAVRRLLDDGFSAEETIVIAPSPAEVAGRLVRAFEAESIPFSSGVGIPLDGVPPVRALLDALELCANQGREALERAIASPYLSSAPGTLRISHWLERSGALEGRIDPEVALRRRASALDPRRASKERRALSDAIDAIAGIRREVRPLAAAGTAADHAARLRGFVATSGLRRRAARAEPGVARRDAEALTRAEDAADDLARSLALIGRRDEELTTGSWRSLLRLAFRSSTLGVSEPVAGAVELWSLSEAPGLSARAAILVGCSRGSFPAPVSHDPLLRDGDRVAIGRVVRRAALATDFTRRRAASHAAFCALAAGRETVVVTWPGPGPEGDGAGPSTLVAEFLSAAGVPIPTAGPRERAPGELQPAAHALLELARAWREGGAPVSTVGPTELDRRLASVVSRAGLEHERRRSVIEKRCSPAAGQIPRALVARLNESLPEEWTPSQLEADATCPYKTFAGLVLKLGEPEEAGLDIDPRDEGSLAHAILERFFRGRLERGALPLAGAADETEELRRVSEILFDRFESDGRTGDAAVWTARKRAVVARLERVLASEVGAGAEARPVLLEYRFGERSGVPPLVFPDEGGEVRVRGRIDRVDASADRITLIDYKNTRSGSYAKKLRDEELGDSNFQIPLYLMAAAGALPGRDVLEATYLLLGSAERTGSFSTTRSDSRWAVDLPARASARAAGVRPFADAVVEAVRRIRSGSFPIVSRGCGRCPFGALCRSQAVAEDEP